MKRYILITMLFSTIFGAVAQESQEEFKPVRRVFVEEYTGTWCGNCPRGHVAMEWIAKDYGDRQISVSYHVDDALDVGGSYFYGVNAVPMGSVDRWSLVDPYYGTPGFPIHLGIYYDIDRALEEEAICSIDIEVEEIGDKAKVTPHIRFIKDEDHRKYQLGYVLKADSTISIYPQENYYSGVEEAMGTPLEEVAKWPKVKRGLSYHDIAIDVKGYKGIAGSLPSTIQAGVDYTPSFTIDFTDRVMSFYKSQMTIVAFVVNKSTGRILNANTYYFGDHLSSEAAVDNVDVEAEVVAREYYDLSGRRIESPGVGSGLIICRERLSDGSTRSVKLIR